MMKRNSICTTIIVTCDAGCGLCWVFDANPATFSAARAAAQRVGWKCVRAEGERRDTCRYCQEKGAVKPPADVIHRAA